MNIIDEITRIMISVCIGIVLTRIAIIIFKKFIDLLIKCSWEVKNGKEK